MCVYFRVPFSTQVIHTRYIINYLNIANVINGNLSLQIAVPQRWRNSTAIVCSSEAILCACVVTVYNSVCVCVSSTHGAGCSAGLVSAGRSDTVYPGSAGPATAESPAERHHHGKHRRGHRQGINMVYACVCVCACVPVAAAEGG